MFEHAKQAGPCCARFFTNGTLPDGRVFKVPDVTGAIETKPTSNGEQHPTTMAKTKATPARRSTPFAGNLLNTEAATMVDDVVRRHGKPVSRGQPKTRGRKESDIRNFIPPITAKAATSKTAKQRQSVFAATAAEVEEEIASAAEPQNSVKQSVQATPAKRRKRLDEDVTHSPILVASDDVETSTHQQLPKTKSGQPPIANEKRKKNSREVHAEDITEWMHVTERKRPRMQANYCAVTVPSEIVEYSSSSFDGE